MCYFIPLFQHPTETSSSHSPPGPHQTTNVDSDKKSQAGLHKNGSINDLICKFSSSKSGRRRSSQGSLSKALSIEVLSAPAPKASSSRNSSEEVGRPIPIIAVTPAFSSQSMPEAVHKTKAGQMAGRVDCPVEGSTKKPDQKPRNKLKKAKYGSDTVGDSGMGSVSADKKFLIDLFDILA